VLEEEVDIVEPRVIERAVHALPDVLDVAAERLAEKLSV
jgi:hypothetical protein